MDMLFEFTDAQLTSFLNDEPFYVNPHTFSLGKSLTEAGEVFRKIIAGRENADVGMADVENDRNREAEVQG
jgi:hypothetical protein